MKWIGKRIMIEPPEFEKGYRWRFWAGFGGDEYGNLSVYLRPPLLPGFVVFYGRTVQREVELPEPGVNEWVDRAFYEMSAAEHRDIAEKRSTLSAT